ncbi:AAA family ATPase [Effusibacillus consociatus]|uniref:AAA family ATPase n=1 Tax=Effusibacillus consociatus TaxID=1117041 RepID=A0ABV9Q676_9BACL
MRAVQVTIASEHWMSALQDITVRAAKLDQVRTILLCIDVNFGTLTFVDEDAESVYKIILPIRSTDEREVLYCRVQVHKLKPMIKLFRVGREITVTCRETTLSFQSGKKHFHVPNHIIEEPSKNHDFAKSNFESHRVIRFLISDSKQLLRSLASCEGTAIPVRVGGGWVCLHTEKFETNPYTSGVFLWPCETFCNRLAQVPEGLKLNCIADDRLVYLSGAGASGIREILIKPYPATAPTLYLSNRENVRKEPDSHQKQDEKNTPPTKVILQPPVEDVEQQLEATVSELLVQADFSIRPEKEEEEPAADPVESMLSKLEQLPGLAFVKKQIREIAQFAAFEKKRMNAIGVPSKSPTLHMAFLGNPGTGKTMVARMLGKIFKELGFLSKGHVVEVDRQLLVGQYMGHTESNLVKYMRRAMGGILFIDEAYALYKKDSNKDFGLNAIHGLVKMMEDYRENLIVILAGYKKEMNEFIGSNPGLRERIPFHIEFPDYTEKELIEIAEYIAQKDHYALTEDAKETLIRQVLREKVDESFGNARTVRNLFEKAKIRHALRAADREPSEDVYTTLAADDFLKDDLSESDSLESLLAELDQLVGLEQVKRLVNQIVDVLGFERKRAEHGFTDEPITTHMAFTGNPGTGKTTVARLMGRILQAMNLLPKGHFVEVSRKDLVAGYIGQTALKTAEKIKEALGGVLFIDEAYALAPRGREDFGWEALTALIKEMEDKKGLLTVILAGYTKEMENLFESNPGLKSRVRFTLHFPDYSPSELVEIVKRKARASDYRLSEEAAEKLWRIFLQESLAAGTDFGNGRLAETVFEQAKLNMSTRISRMQEAQGREILCTITEDDIIIDSEA